MMKVVNVSTICFESILFKKTFEEEKLEETDELNKDDDDDANEQERDT